MKSSNNKRYFKILLVLKIRKKKMWSWCSQRPEESIWSPRTERELLVSILCKLTLIGKKYFTTSDFKSNLTVALSSMRLPRGRGRFHQDPISYNSPAETSSLVDWATTRFLDFPFTDPTVGLAGLRLVSHSNKFHIYIHSRSSVTLENLDSSTWVLQVKLQTPDLYSKGRSSLNHWPIMSAPLQTFI